MCTCNIISKHRKNDFKCLFAFLNILIKIPFSTIYWFLISSRGYGGKLWAKLRITALTGTWLAFFLTMAAGAVPVVIRWRCEGGEFGRCVEKHVGSLICGFCVGHDFIGKMVLYFVLHVHLASTSFASWAVTFDGYLVLIRYPWKERMENGWALWRSIFYVKLGHKHIEWGMHGAGLICFLRFFTELWLHVCKHYLAFLSR